MKKRSGKPKSMKSKIRRAAEDIIIACLLVIMIFSAWKLYNILKDYKSNQAEYDKISTQSRDGEFTGDIDFDALRKINPDVVAWIYYESSVIDYPIVQGTDNDKYIYTRFDGEESGFGCLFVDAATESPFRQFNTIVYGHHMKNGSMFADLKKLKSPEYCRQHPRLELITPEGKYHLEIWAFLNQPSDSKIYETNIQEESERLSYIETASELSLYTTDIAIEPTDRLVVLSTCAYEYDQARYMVVCKMTPW
ncbi:MAG: class B sortase [Mogibacterium sp.]|nr:class B sortase [Mogibacterium sp.]